MIFDLINGDEAFWVPTHILDAVQNILPIQVLDRSTTPPGSPTLFDAYLVIGTATGAWAGHEDDIALSVCDKTSGDRTWVFIPPREGHIVWVNDEDEHYIYDGTQWITHAVHIANHHDLEDVRDVTLLNLAEEDILIWDGADWVNITPADFAALFSLGDVGDVTLNSLQTYNVLWWDGDEWVNISPCTLLGQATLSCLGDVSGTPNTGDLLRWNGTNWVPYNLGTDDVDNESGAPGATVTNVFNTHNTTINNHTTTINTHTTEIGDLDSRVTAIESGGSGGGGVNIVGGFCPATGSASGSGWSCAVLGSGINITIPGSGSGNITAGTGSLVVTPHEVSGGSFPASNHRFHITNSATDVWNVQGYISDTGVAETPAFYFIATW